MNLITLAFLVSKIYVLISSLLLLSTIFLISSDTISFILEDNLHTSLAFKAGNTSAANSQPASHILQTDKKTYGLGDFVEVSGSVEDMVEGKTLRLDIYRPDGNVLYAAPNDTIQSNIRISPDNNGLYSYTFQLPETFDSNYRGTYRIAVTYLGNTTETTFTVPKSTVP